MDCEVCGARNANRRAEIEGVIMNVCDKCAGLGKEMAKVRKVETKRAARLPEELSQAMVEGFGTLIRKKRESLGLTQEQLGAKLQLNPNLIRRIESGWEPPLEVARKIEKQLKLKLIEEASHTLNKKREEGGGLTIGDIASIKGEEE